MRVYLLINLILLMIASAGCNNPSGGSVIGQGNAPFLQKPAPFSFTQIRAANGVIDVNWQESKRVASYTFVMGTDPANITTPVPACSGGTDERCHLTGLDPNTIYYFDITATNDAGTRKVSAIGSALSVGTFDITSSSPTDGAIDLSWSASSNSTAYNVTYGTISGTYKTTISNVTSPYHLSGLTNGVRYYVRVIAVNTQNGYALSTSEVNHQPYGPLPAPTGLTIASVPGQITLDWADSSGASEYKIFKGTSAGSLTQIPGGPYTTSNYVDTSVSNGQTYYYAIKAYNGFDSTISATVFSQPIAAFSISSVTAAPGPGQVTVTWATPVTGAASFDIAYGTNPAALSSLVSNATSPYIFNSLTPNLPYYFKVVAKNTIGSGTSLNSSNQLSATPLIPLSTPTGLVASATPGQTVLNWNDVTGATSYKIYKGTSAGSLTLVAGGPYTTSDFTDNSVTNGTVYYYAVAATNGSFDSATTAAVQIKPISVFTLSSATVATFSSANLSWTAATGGDNYDILYGTAPGTYTLSSANRISPATLTSLTGATTYYVAIRARNAIGAGTNIVSNELSFTTTATFPTVTIDTYPLINNANKAAYTVSGTCTENTRVVTVTIGSVTATPTCTASAWTATMNVTPVADSAALTITAVHTNSGGNNNTKTRTVVKDTTNPTVAITAFPNIKNSNKAAYTVSGTCSENTRTVTVDIGGIAATPTCTSLAWTTTVDASGLADGSVSITADHDDAAGNNATQATRTITKDTSIPSVAITSSPTINNTNKAAYSVSGTCSDTGQSVTVKVGATTASVTCTLITWSATLNVSANADSGAILVTADHSDAVGNTATQASALVIKDTVAPTITITVYPLINNANKDAYTISGACSENSQIVSVNVGGVTDTPTCAASAWTSTLDVSAIADSATVSITATHVDTAANSATATRTVVKNTNLPTVAITSSTIINNSNKAAYPVSGTCSENGRPVSVNVGGVSGSPTCTTGAWSTSLNVTAVADNAAVSITADHSDTVGNSALQASSTVLKDTVIPTVAITSAPVINNGNKAAYSVSGTCSENSRNVVVAVGSASTTVTCSASAWSASLNVTAVADGASVAVTANHTDAAGNAATQASTTVVKDTTNPTVAITSYPTINNVNNSAYTVSGTCSENTRLVSVSVGGVTATPTCSALAWSATVDVSAVADNNALPITADHTDAAGNSATQATRTVIKDTAPPTVSITSSAVVNNANKAAYPVSGTCSETGQNVQVKVGATTANVTCTLLTWSASMNVSANGDSASLLVTADHSDSAGNAAVQAAITVVKDTVNPTVAITSAPTINTANKGAYTVSGTCSENTRNVSVSVGGVTSTPVCSALAWSATLNVTSVSDSATVSVTANHSDSAGNNATQASTTVIKNTANPTVAITSSPIINNTNKTAYTVSGTCSENTRQVSVSVGGVTATPTCSALAWTTTVNVTAVADNGSVSITADHDDSDGNVASQASTTVLKDTVIPTVAITSSPTINNSNKAAYPISGTCSENTRTVSVAVGSVTSSPVCTAGSWSATLNVTALADSATVAATANHTDAAANAATQASATVVKDTSNPTVAITAPTVINNANKASYTVSGTCSENTRAVSVNVGGVTGTPTCSGGSWTISLNVSGVSDSASVAITADHSDAAGNNATQATASVVKDTTPPTVAMTSTPIINNANKSAYTVSGTCSENTRTVTVNVGGVGATPTCSANAWTSTLNVTAVADNASVSISADHTDASGNAASQATANVLKDTVIPTVAITSAVAINNSNNTAYPISGTCSENTRAVTVNVGGVISTPTCSGGAWSASMNVSGVADNASVAVTANHSDAAGNNATQASTTVVKATGLPTVGISAPVAINNTNKASYPVSGTCSENTRTVSINVGGVSASPTCSAGAWSTSVNVSGVSDGGSIAITADHSDAVGNNANQASASVLKDTVIPTVTITSSPVINNANKSSYTVAGACSENTRTVSVSVGGVASSPTCTALAWSATVNVSAVADSATLLITANHTDVAGNSATQASTTVVKDTANPTVAITAPVAINNSNKAFYPVSGTCSENTRTVTVSVGGVSGTPTCSAGAWSTSLNVTAVSDSASVSITADHTDTSGNNATQATATVVKDTANPTVAITAPVAINNSNKASYTVSGTCSENTRTVSVNVGGVTATPTCSSLAWSTTVNVTAVADNAALSITADHTDAYSNSASQATASALKDTVIPTVTIGSAPAINNTNKATYPVSGSCSENTRTVTVVVGGVTSTPTCTALMWSASVNVSGIADSGSVAVTANHTDAAGNAATQASTTVAKDTTDPVVAITSSTAINNTNKASYTVSGTCSENTRSVTVDVGGVTGSPTCSAGTWTTNLNVTSVADSATVAITADHSDTSGNAAPQATASVLKDTVIPTITITSNTVINNSNKASYTVSGACSENTRTVSVTVGSASGSATCTALAWTTNINVTAVADNAAVSITANHTDVAGNSATQASTTVLKDTSSPTVAISAPTLINNTNKAAYTVSGSCSENTRTVAVSVGGITGTPTCSGLAWTTTLDVSSLSDGGSISITANHTDAAGNAATQASTSVAKDTTPPTVAISAPGAINNSNKAAYSVSGTCSENTRTVSVNVGGVAATPTCSALVWSTTVNVTAVADNAAVTITADHTDAAGNTAIQAASSALKDTVIPTVTITSSPVINNTNKAAYTVSGACSENTRTVSVSVGGVSGTPTCTALAWSATLNVTAVPDGASVSITANHTDLAGNAATQASTTVVKDATLPTVAITSSPVINNANKAAYTVSGTCSENTRTVSVNIGGVSASPTCSAGAWSTGAINVSAVADSATVAITADHTDINGNNAVQATASIVKDTVAATVAITSAPNINNSNKTAYTASGTCSENGRAVAISIGGVVSSPTCSAGAWTTGAINVSAAADSATLAVSANHADAAGNSAPQASTTIVKDTSNPTVAITSTPVINNSNKASYTVSGTCSDSGQNVVVNVGSVNTTVSCLILTWSATVDVSGNPDSLTLLITADHTDSAGNTAVQAGTTVVKDTVNPTVAITSAPTINNANKASYTVTGTCSENTRTVSVSVGGVAATPTCSSGSWTTGSINVSAAADSGTLSITANHTDSAGNTASQASTTVVKDTANPTVAIDTPTVINNANKAAYTVTGTCSENTRTVVVSVGGVAATPTCSSGTWTTGSINVTAATDSATLSITANISDTSGNTATPASASVLKDTVLPGITLSSTEPATTSASPFTVRATFTEAVTGVASTDFVVGNASISSFTAVSGTVYDITVTPTTDGSVTVNMAAGAAQDVAGNNSTIATQLSRTYVSPGLLTFAVTTTHDFGSVPVGGSADVTMLVNKSGTNTVTAVSEVGLAAPFAFKGGSYPGTGGTCTTSITGTCSIVVTYSPTAAGSHSDTIQLQYNNGGGIVSATRDIVGSSSVVSPTMITIDGPQGVPINQCIPFTINAQTAAGQNANVTAAQTVTMVVNNGTGTFYSNATCSTTAATTSIAINTSSKIVYFKSTTTAQFLTLVFNPASLSSATKDVVTSNNPTRISFTTPAEMETSLCRPIAVDFVDGTGARAGKNVAVTVNLGKTGNAIFYSDVNCTGVITSVVYPAFTDTKTVYIKDATAQSVTITLTDAASALTQDTASISFVNALTWWNTAYMKRIPITIDNEDQSTAHTNMPVLVRLDSSKINYADILSGGADIRFTLSDHTTTLSYDIESWNSSGTSYVWVKVPSIAASADMVIFMYYNNSSASNGESPSGTWSAFQGIWNMDKTGANYYDATNLGKNAVPEGSVSDITGPVGNAVNFPGSSAINTGSNLSTLLGVSTTMSFWMKTTQLGQSQFYNSPNITGVRDDSSFNEIYFGYITNSGTLGITSKNGQKAEASFIVNDGSWRHVTMSRNSSTGQVKFYINGVLNDTASSGSGAVTTSFSRFGQLTYPAGSPNYYIGGLDSVRIQSGVATDIRIKAEYKYSVESNISFGSPEDL